MPGDGVRVHYDALESRYGTHAAERALKMGEALYEVLVGATVHDMRGVLTPLKEWSYGLKRNIEIGRFDTESYMQALDKIFMQVTFLERLLNDMSAYSRQQSQDRRPERFADLIQEAQMLVQDGLGGWLIRSGPVDLTIRVEENVTVEAARHQLVLALANVLRNAYEAFERLDGTYEDGKIELAAEAWGEELRVTVSDTGMGMDEADLEAVREFVPGRTSKKNRGTGFGLPIAQKSIKAHGGTMEIHSELDVGTTITMRLPLYRKKEGI